MKQQSLLLIAALLLAGAGIYGAQLGIRSTAFAGPDFHARSNDECAAVYSEFTRHLEEIGFHPSALPSGSDSWAGVHSEGAKPLLYLRTQSSNQQTFVYVDLTATVARTRIKWEVYGTSRKAKSAEQDAYRLALELDDWFRGRNELNELPQNLKDKKRQGFNDHLAKNQES